MKCLKNVNKLIERTTCKIFQPLTMMQNTDGVRKWHISGSTLNRPVRFVMTTADLKTVRNTLETLNHEEK